MEFYLFKSLDCLIDQPSNHANPDACAESNDQKLLKKFHAFLLLKFYQSVSFSSSSPSIFSFTSSVTK